MLKGAGAAAATATETENKSSIAINSQTIQESIGSGSQQPIFNQKEIEQILMEDQE